MASLELKDANDYPRFCPQCGNRRLLQRTKLNSPVFVGPEGVIVSEPVVGQWESVPQCTRCGLDFTSIPDPATALTRKLTSLNDAELAQVMLLFYPNFNNLISVVANQLSKSVSHTMRVLTGERKSHEIIKALTIEFRRRLVESKVDELIP